MEDLLNMKIFEVQKNLAGRRDVNMEIASAQASPTSNIRGGGADKQSADGSAQLNNTKFSLKDIYNDFLVSISNGYESILDNHVFKMLDMNDTQSDSDGSNKKLNEV